MSVADRAAGFVPVSRRWAGAVLASPNVVWWCGISLAASGLCGGVSTLLLMRQEFLAYGVYGMGSGPTVLMGVFTSLTVLLIAGGLAGIFVLTRDTSRRIRWLAVTGLLLTEIPGFLYGLAALYFALFTSEYGGYTGTSSFGVIIPVLGGLYAYAGTAGILLLGVAALWARGLGRSRWLLLGIGVLLAPLTDVLLFHYFRPEAGGMNALYAGEASAAREVIVGIVVPLAPDLLASLGWIWLGCVMFGAKNHEAKLEAAARQHAEKLNLNLAVRLYDEAWGLGELEVLGEIVAPDLEDHYHGTRGLEQLRRNVAGLRRTFPDLRFTVEEQSASGDEVMTRWSMSGTDKGGVLWYPPTGKRAQMRGVFTDRFEDGRLVEHWGESDTEGMLSRLGLANAGDGRDST